ncbi:hypothetical protein D2Q93_06970 [Alicyclobacillaceae bacterium I2511]|nr:hypothetical protein D2Q93_06970 [Alicyclobacillaceae bacterium I2511]
MKNLLDKGPPSVECIVCGRSQSIGLNICGQFICSDCEQEIVHTEVSDPRYPYFIECMKQIWLAALS